MRSQRSYAAALREKEGSARAPPKKIPRRTRISYVEEHWSALYIIADGGDGGEGCKRGAWRGSRPVTLSSQKACAPKYQHDLSSSVCLARCSNYLGHMYVRLGLDTRVRTRHDNREIVEKIPALRRLGVLEWGGSCAARQFKYKDEGV